MTSITNTMQEGSVLQKCDKAKMFWKDDDNLKLLLQDILKHIKFVDCLLALCLESLPLVYAV